LKFDFKYVTQDEREQLYEEVWSNPIPVMAEKYGISDTTLRKHLKRLVIPTPKRGYWNKVNKGETVKRDELPGVTKALSKYVRNYVIKYRTDLDDLDEEQLSSQEDLHLLREETKEFINKKCSLISVPKQLRNPHQLISNHKEEISYRKKRDRELNKSYNQVLKPTGFKENSPVLSIDVSKPSINRGYRILDTLIKNIEDMEGYIRTELKDRKDISSIVIMGTIFEFQLNEKNNKLTLLLLAENWMSFKNQAKTELQFRDLKDLPLEDQVGEIIYEMFVVGNKFFAEYKLEELIWEKECAERERLRKLEELRNNELTDVKELIQAVSDWDKARKIREFAIEFEAKVQQLEEGKEKEKLLDWITRARDKADWLDPLVEKEDELLGKSVSLFQQILKSGN